MERETIRNVRLAVRSGKLPEEFTPSQVNRVLGIHWAGTFLPKHRVGNPGGFYRTVRPHWTRQVSPAPARTLKPRGFVPLSEELICPIIFARFRLE